MKKSDSTTFINSKALDIELDKFSNNRPYAHLIIDDFFKEDVAKQLSKSFFKYEDRNWHIYKNAIENKKTLNSWNHFNPLQYKVFTELNSFYFVHILGKMVGNNLYADPGLHGGGLHIHTNDGNLNPHLDYSIHPKIGLQRRLNLIVYLEKDYKEEYGGHLGLWGKKTPSLPGNLAKEILPKFNRAVLLDTTQNSWHGMSRKLTLPEDKYRKSIASYYLQIPQKTADRRTRALFAPRKEQIGNKGVMKLIKMRSKEKTYSKAYVSELGKDQLFQQGKRNIYRLRLEKDSTS